MPCSSRPLLPLSDKDIRRFWKHVEVRGPDECWPWSGGRFRVVCDGVLRSLLPSRVAFYLARNEDPYPLFVCHRCDYPPCCNEKHFFRGTHKDNMDDMVKKGRSPNNAGESNPRAKLTVAQVEEIRRLCATGSTTRCALGKRYGVTDVTISYVANGKNWSHSSSKR